MSPRAVPISAALVSSAALALAASPGARADGRASPGLFRWQLGGYGELGGAFYDFGADQSRDGGARRDRRVELDATRLALELEAIAPHDLEIEAELEIEHGGTGAAREIEYDEFGEFETEVEKGGEVQLEEFAVKKTWGRVQVAAGKFYVGIGLLSSRYRPTDFLGATRAEGETTLVPGQWDEMGVATTVRWPHVRLTAQLVNGLDSSGFSSARWVASGHQGAFETVRASDVAGVVRLDVIPRDDIEVGVAGYYGGTTRTRPKPDLVPDCADPDPDAVAPCGYVSAPLAIVEAHGVARLGPVRGSALALWGHLASADVISTRNARLSDQLGAPRTPVASQAVALFAEVGVDVAPWLGIGGDHALEPFARVERYDTMFRVAAGQFDNPRFARNIARGGVAYTWRRAFTVKLDGGVRWFGSRALRHEHSIELGLGFVL